MDRLKQILHNLYQSGCSGVKISFEDEGALLNEMMTMRYLTTVVGVELSVKIGGCEDKRSIHDCIHLHSDTIVAPMIESEFALQKYIASLEACKYTGKKSFNLETIAGHSNLDKISPLLNKMDSVTFGRVDFVSSMKHDRSYANSDAMYTYVEEVFTEAKKHNILCNLGGAISIDSKEFIAKLISNNLLDYFETRYIIFDVKKINIDEIDSMLYYANLFEVEWLKYINARYTGYADKDRKRIAMIQERLDNNKRA